MARSVSIQRRPRLYFGGFLVLAAFALAIPGIRYVRSASDMADVAAPVQVARADAAPACKVPTPSPLNDPALLQRLRQAQVPNAEQAANAPKLVVLNTRGYGYGRAAAPDVAALMLEQRLRR